MKNIFLILAAVVSFSSHFAFAGLPQQDPVVANVRARFGAGQTPSVEFLTSAFFECYRMSAVQDDNTKEKFGTQIYFEVQGGFYVLKTANDKFFINNTLLANNGKEILGNVEKFDTDYQGTHVFAVRADGAGYLMIEISNLLVKDKKRLLPAASVDGTAINYMSCSPLQK